MVIPKPKGVVEPIKAASKNLGLGKFAITVVLSTLLEAGLQTGASLIGTGDLAAVSKRPETWIEIVGLLGWKVAKLGVYWACDFDGMH